METEKLRWQPLEQTVPPEVLRAEVEAWARRIRVEPRQIRIAPMKRKWASCSSVGRLSFNRELLEQPARFRAEVIVHELLHLKVPNHGPLFRALLRAHLGSRGHAPPSDRRQEATLNDKPAAQVAGQKNRSNQFTRRKSPRS
jgi:metallopeptidase YgjP-like protein